MTHKTIAEMTNDEFMKHVVEDCLQGWIPLKTYLRLFLEETKIAVESRIQRGHWRKGTHFNTPAGANMWVNLQAIREWASGKEAKAEALAAEAQAVEAAKAADKTRLASEDAPDTLG